MNALLPLLLALLDVDPPRTVVKPIEDKVRAMLTGGFGEERAAAWAPRLALPIARVKSEERRALLLKELPDAVQFHKFMLQGVEEFIPIPGLPPFVTPKEELAEGLEIQLAYLAARVERAARRPLDVENRKAVEAQIDRIMEAAKLALGAKARKEFDGLAATWKASFDMPYNSCLDRPLSEEDLQEVLVGMKDVASTATGTDAEIIAAVRESAYRAVGRCFRDFDALQKRSDDWSAKRQARHEDYLRANGMR